MHTDITNTTVTVLGRRDLSPTAKLIHWTLIICSFGGWYPVYWIVRRSTRNVRY